MILKKLSVRKRFMRLLSQEFLRKLWVEGVTAIVLLFALPVQMALKLGAYQDRLNSMPKGILFELLIKNDPLLGAIFLLSVLMALAEFSYLFRRDKVDFYHSLPVSRTMHFAYRYLNGLLQFLIPYLIFYAAAIMVGIMNGALVVGYGKELVVTSVLYLLFFCVFYAVSLIAVQLSGSYLSAGIVLAIVHFAPMFFCYVLNEYGLLFLRTYVNTEIPLLYGYGSAVTICRQILQVYENMRCWSTGIVLLFTAMLLGPPLIAYGLFLKRPAEKTNCGLAYPVMEPVFRLIAVVEMGLFAGLLLRSISYDQDDKWLFFGLAAGCVLMHCIMQMVMQMNFRAFLEGKLSLVLCTLVTVLLMGTFRYDLMGYDQYIPDESQLDCVGISIQELEYYRNYIQEYTDEDLEKRFGSNYEYYTIFDQIYSESERYRLLQEMNLKNIWPILEIVQHSVENPKWKVYDANVTVCFKLKNGRCIFRQYQMDMEKEWKLCEKIFTMDDFKEALYPILNRGEENTNIWLNCNYSNDKEKITLSDTRFTSLLRTYKRELKELQLQTLREEVPLFTLEFTNQQDGFYNSYPVYPSFRHTLTLLKGYGYEVEPVNDLLYELQISYQKVDTYEDAEEADQMEAIRQEAQVTGNSVNFGSKTMTVNAAKQLEQLRPYLVPQLYRAFNLTLKEVESDYYVTGYLRDPSSGEVTIQDFLIEKGKVPDFLKGLEDSESP